MYSYSVVHKCTLSRFSFIPYSLYIFPYLVFTFYHISTHAHVRFRRACRFVFVWPLQYARHSKCGSSYVRYTFIGGTRSPGISDRIAHEETTRLGYNANAPATIAATGRATGRWPYQMLNGQHNATYIHRYHSCKHDCRRIGRTLLLPSRNVWPRALISPAPRILNYLRRAITSDDARKISAKSFFYRRTFARMSAAI